MVHFYFLSRLPRLGIGCNQQSPPASLTRKRSPTIRWSPSFSVGNKLLTACGRGEKQKQLSTLLHLLLNSPKLRRLHYSKDRTELKFLKLIGRRWKIGARSWLRSCWMSMRIGSFFPIVFIFLLTHTFSPLALTVAGYIRWRMGVWRENSGHQSLHAAGWAARVQMHAQREKKRLPEWNTYVQFTGENKTDCLLSPYIYVA